MDYNITNQNAQGTPITLFTSARDNEPQAVAADWDNLIELLGTIDDDHPEITEEQKKYRLPAWSPALYKAGATRGNSGISHISCLAYDVDNGTAPDDIALALELENVNFLIYPTFKHTDDHPRWRLVVPLAQPIPVQLFGPVHKRFGDNILGPGNYDASCLDPAHIYFYRIIRGRLPGRYIPPQHKSGGFIDGFSMAEQVDDLEDLLTEPEPAGDFELHVERTDPGRHWTPGEVTGMMQFVEVPEDNGSWFKLVCALAHHGHATGKIEEFRQIAHTWSATDEAGYDGAAVDRIDKLFDSPSDYRGEQIKIGRIIKIATESGWDRPDLVESGHYDLRPLGLQALNDPGQPEWLFDDFMNRGTVTMITGQPGKGKSMLMMQLALSIAGNLPWLDMPPAADCPVVYFNAEDSTKKFRRRMRNFFEVHDIDQATQERIVNRLTYLGAETDFKRIGSKNMVKDLADSINATYPGQRPIFIVDPLITFKPSDAQLNTDDMGIAIDFFRQLRALTDGDVLVIHHMSDKQSADDGPLNYYMGSTMINATVRQGFALVQMNDDDLVQYVEHQVEDDARGSYVKLVMFKADEGELVRPVMLRRGLGGVLVRLERVDINHQLGDLVMDDAERDAMMAFFDRLTVMVRQQGGSMSTRTVRDNPDRRAQLMGEEWAEGREGIARFTEWVNLGVTLRRFRRNGNGPLRL